MNDTDLIQRLNTLEERVTKAARTLKNYRAWMAALAVVVSIGVISRFPQDTSVLLLKNGPYGRLAISIAPYGTAHIGLIDKNGQSSASLMLDAPANPNVVPV